MPLYGLLPTTLSKGSNRDRNSSRTFSVALPAIFNTNPGPTPPWLPSNRRHNDETHAGGSPAAPCFWRCCCCCAAAIPPPLFKLRKVGRPCVSAICCTTSVSLGPTRTTRQKHSYGPILAAKDKEGEEAAEEEAASSSSSPCNTNGSHNNNSSPKYTLVSDARRSNAQDSPRPILPLVYQSTRTKFPPRATRISCVCW